MKFSDTRPKVFRIPERQARGLRERDAAIAALVERAQAEFRAYAESVLDGMGIDRADPRFSWNLDVGRGTVTRTVREVSDNVMPLREAIPARRGGRDKESRGRGHA